MPDFPPQTGDVVAVASRQEGEGRRSFELEGELPADAAPLPDLSRIEHESQLVEEMRERGYRLTMVGGGAAGPEDRRFYFRKR